MAANSITVLLADDHTLIRESLRMLLEVERDIQVVGEAGDGRQAVEMTRKLRPAVVVMDIAMPLLNGLDATRQIHQDFPDTKVLILSCHSHDAYVESAMTSGAVGYLNKQISAHLLCEAVKEIFQGHTFLCPDIAQGRKQYNWKSIDRNGPSTTKAFGLSSREREVLQLIAEGSANKQIAAGLGISIKTVEKHRNNLMQKLDIHETASLTRYAVAGGIVE